MSLYWAGEYKVGHARAKNRLLLLSLLYHNVNTIYINTEKSSPLMQNLLGILLFLWKWDTATITKGMDKNIFLCNLFSGNQFYSQAWLHVAVKNTFASLVVEQDKW